MEPRSPSSSADFQGRTHQWLCAAFGADRPANRAARARQFFAAAVNLAQACGLSAHDLRVELSHPLRGDHERPAAEIGRVMLALAALAEAQGARMHQAADDELARAWGALTTIRERERRVIFAERDAA